MPLMDGPQNYTEAQELLTRVDGPDEYSASERAEMLKKAHVHAMLAVAASNVDAAYRNNVIAWNEAMGTHPMVERCINGKPWSGHTFRCSPQCNWAQRR